MSIKICQHKFNFFPKLFILLFLISSSSSQANSIQSDQKNLYFTDDEVDVIAHGKFELFDKKIINKMKDGANGDNKAATTLQYALGDYYYQKEEYKLSFNYFSKCSGSYLDCDFHLGNLYLDGLGVLQDDEKAINHFLKSVKSGNSISAYNLSVIYGKKAFRSFDILNQEKMDSYYYNLMRSYAWRKVSMAMGNKTAITLNNKEESILLVFEELKNILSRANKLNSANKLAEQFCSSIPACAQ
ncbi:MAG: tetratricopeptide repeat protein [Candidatus Berkiella sp.]